MARASNRLPDSVEVAIIGAGIVGAATAFHLRRQGARVALFDKGWIVGKILSDLIGRGATNHDLGAFMASRF